MGVMDCPHERFEANVEVNRLAPAEGRPPTSYSADVRVWCADCEEPFEWVGAPVGLSPRAPAVSVDGRELRAPLRPASAPAGFGETGPGFHITIPARG
jgi:hypothetical protein